MRDPSEHEPDGAHDGDDHEDGGGGPSGRVLLIAAAILVVLGLLLSTKIRELGNLQDCILSGRTNCAPVDTRDR